MNELIKTITRDDGTIAVSGRELHDFLEVDTPYTQWFDRMIDYGFTENADFKGLSQKSEKPIGGRPRIDHVMTLDMAKEVAMIQRTDRGKQARQYFIEIDKQAHHDMTGQAREMTLINESGLYSLVLSSKLPTAKEFKHWVTHEVLPSSETMARLLRQMVPRDFKVN
nr:MAG: antirepressor [Bacteriophage sp.]